MQLLSSPAQEFSREKEAILKTAPRGGDGHPLAPNGKRSKLTEDQWATVRTRAFKQWFGDWEIAASTAKRRASTFGEAREAAKEFQGKPLANHRTGIEATVSRNTLDKMLTASAVWKSESTSLHALAVANVDTLFERAMLGWSKPDKNADPNIVSIHRFFSPMVANGRALLVKMTVKETAQKDRSNPLFTVEAVEFHEMSPAAEWVGEMASADGIDPRTTRSAGDIETLARGIQDFNPENVSKTVDANGEPLVVRLTEVVQHACLQPRSPAQISCSSHEAAGQRRP